MCTGKKCFKIWNISAKSHISSAPLAQGGTASALRTAACNHPSSFYWFPSIVNFVGIDGVLVNGDNIYALQSTIADTHDGPLEGLRKVWKTIGAAVAELFNWHFVLVSDNKALANKYAKELAKVNQESLPSPSPYKILQIYDCPLNEVAGRILTFGHENAQHFRLVDCQADLNGIIRVVE
jgi:hypothetical protein